MEIPPLHFFCTAQKFAFAVGRTTRTLRRWAKVGFGPKPHKIRGRILYELGEVQAWLRELSANR